jgi:threonylcarbamoyladenosine tRNA methylthiotransferase MtaB
VVAEARERQDEGAQEIVITGTQLGAYGRDTGEGGPADLLAALLAGTNVPRIRMSSLQPQDITPRLIELWQDARLCRHLHLALQSGSEGVLQRMRRRYSRQQYREAVERLRAAIPGVAITTDVIAGFPGETDAEFEECWEFCREMAFAGMHVFPYSQRDRTAAARLPGQLADSVKKQRVHRLIALADGMAGAFRRRLTGRVEDVLWEKRDPAGDWEGLTDTYVHVRAASSADLHNRLTPALITGEEEDGLRADLEVKV